MITAAGANSNSRSTKAGKRAGLVGADDLDAVGMVRLR